MTKAQIMKRAWEIKKEDNSYIFGLCLKMAWAEAKEMKEEMTQREKDEQEALHQATQFSGYARLVANGWVKYGKNRTYVEVRIYTNGHSLKRVIKVGYQDNDTEEWITDKDLY